MKTVVEQVKLFRGDTLCQVLFHQGAEHDHIVVPREFFVAGMVELATLYDLEFDLADSSKADWTLLVSSNRFKDVFPTVEINWPDGSDNITVGTKNGDTPNSVVIGEGPTTIQAMADLLRSQGFESKYKHDREGPVTAITWLEGFNYGFDRKSNEILQAEMESITAPDKGAW